LIGGTAPSYGYVGANASLRIRRSLANGTNSQFVTPTGFRLFGYISDTWVNGFEVSVTPNGVEIDGQSISTPTAHQDVTFENLRIDGGTGTGIKLKNLNASAMIDFVNPYIALASSATGQAAIAFSNAFGTVTLTGGQAICDAVGASQYGLDVISSSGLHLNGFKIRGAAIPLNISGSSNVTGTVSIFNPSGAASGAAIVIGNSSSGVRLAPDVKGAGNTFSMGVNFFDSTSTRCKIDATGIDPACLTTGVARVKIGASPVTIGTPGYYTSAGAPATSGQGIQVDGVLA
ncbi:MAG: hypothetical protein KGR26_13740, partial [Cyanobacteria bacterium REEB65]|nr:hypothetical protein [Cyanobacteria bacterium REEB65]